MKNLLKFGNFVVAKVNNEIIFGMIGNMNNSMVSINNVIIGNEKGLERLDEVELFQEDIDMIGEYEHEVFTYLDKEVLDIAFVSVVKGYLISEGNLKVA